MKLRVHSPSTLSSTQIVSRNGASEYWPPLTLCHSPLHYDPIQRKAEWKIPRSFWLISVSLNSESFSPHHPISQCNHANCSPFTIFIVYIAHFRLDRGHANTIDQDRVDGSSGSQFPQDHKPYQVRSVRLENSLLHCFQIRKQKLNSVRCLLTARTNEQNKRWEALRRRSLEWSHPQ